MEEQKKPEQKLFAVYLGGKAPRSNTELHDVVFVVGESIKDTYGQLLEKWFGSAEGLHIDSWMELRVVDGHRVRLSREKSTASKKLYFVNLGAYIPGQFTEAHGNTFLVAETEREVVSRAKGALLRGLKTVHKDDVYDVDDVLEIGEVGGLSIHLEPTDDEESLDPQNGYHIIPKSLVAAFLEKLRQLS